MKAIFLQARGGSESLVYGDATTPRPVPGEVVVAVHAAGVTPSELTWMPTWTTKAGEPRPFPIIPGHEFSGIIQSVGNGVTNFAEGDAVFGMNDWFGDGTQAEYCVTCAEDIAAKPRSIDHALAASTPISALTAWQGLLDRAHLTAGERVLIHGGAGGVGSFAVQLAQLHGAHVIATASANNLEFVRNLGATEVVDYKAGPFESVAREMDVVFDTVGGETLARSWGVLKPNGRLVTIASSAESTADARLRDAFFIVEPRQAQLAKIASLIDEGQLRPIAGGVFPLSEARQAYQHKSSHGKVVLRVQEDSATSSV